MRVSAGRTSELRTNQRRSLRRVLAAFCAALIAFAVAPAEATRVADVTHLKGRRQNQLLGYGLVIGLNGTGDGGKYLPSILQLQAMLEKFEIPVPLAALKDTKNVAIVMIEATIPENGVREGDRIDVRVNSVGAAKTLAGGHLVMTPLQSIGLDRVLAFASGPIRLQDVKIGTSGIVKDGATMEADIIHNYISEEWEITLVLEDVHASHALASVIAQVVNENASEVGQVRQIAYAFGPKNVVVRIPAEERQHAAEFIARIERTELLMPAGEARIVINRKTGTIAIGEDVEIGPAVISHNGMSIMTTQPPPMPSPDQPVVQEQHAIAIEAPRNQRGAAKLQELVAALNQLNVPANEIIEIVENLHRLGKINAKLVIVE